jgi:hypothetical protein
VWPNDGEVLVLLPECRELCSIRGGQRSLHVDKHVVDFLDRFSITRPRRRAGIGDRQGRGIEIRIFR